MKVFQTIIKKITYDNNFMLLECEKKKLKIFIINGNVEIDIFTNENKKVSYSYLENNDHIIVYYKKREDEYVIPHKIFINTKYILNSDSSDFEPIF